MAILKIFNDPVQLHALHAHTGTDCILITVRSSLESYLRPFIAFTSDRGPDFFSLSLNQTLSEVALRYEAYCLSGVEGKMLPLSESTYYLHVGIYS